VIKRIASHSDEMYEVSTRHPFMVQDILHGFPLSPWVLRFETSTVCIASFVFLASDLFSGWVCFFKYLGE
jgi:hypothetical protein